MTQPSSSVKARRRSAFGRARPLALALTLLHSAGLSIADVTVQDIGFTQIAALVSHRVDAVMGYANNEPVQLQLQGVAIRTLNVWQAQPLISNGIVVLQGELRNHPAT